MLPYMEEKAKYAQFWGTTQDGNASTPGSGQWNASAEAPPTWLCPSDPSNNGSGLIRWPSGTVLGVASYVYNVQALGHFVERDVKQPTPRRKRRIPKDFPDGTSKTFVLAERYAVCRDPDYGRNAWLGMIRGTAADPFMALNANSAHPLANTTYDLPQDAPKNADCDRTKVQSGHRGIHNVLMADGSVKGVNVNLTQATWTRLIRPDDGVQLGRDW
jgi:prepilin-type processing-associated H-X9-DG protein